jgi:hypothetical protein
VIVLKCFENLSAVANCSRPIPEIFKLPQCYKPIDLIILGYEDVKTLPRA